MNMTVHVCVCAISRACVCVFVCEYVRLCVCVCVCVCICACTYVSICMCALAVYMYIIMYLYSVTSWSQVSSSKSWEYGSSCVLSCQFSTSLSFKCTIYISKYIFSKSVKCVSFSIQSSDMRITPAPCCLD